MKKLYISPETEVLTISENDVIRTSLTKADPTNIGANVGYGDSSWF